MRIHIILLLSLSFSLHLFANMIIVDNIADLKHIKEINTNEKVVVHVLGYYMAGDGGGGSFYLDKNSKGNFDDGINIETGISKNYSWRRLYTEPVNVKWFGAKGDGKSNDTKSILKASKYQYVFFPLGSYLSDYYPKGLNSIGTGKVLLKKNNRVQEVGNFIYAGSIKSRGGEKRADLKGGLFIGGNMDDRRGIQLHTEGASSWAFLKERSESGQSLLFTLQPNPLTVNAESIPNTNRVKALINNFSSKYWAKNDIVHFNKKNYRIKKIINNKIIELVKDNKKKTNVYFKKTIKDNLILPAFYFNVNADIENNILKLLSGDLKSKFSKYNYNKERVSALIKGKWCAISSNGSKKYTYKLKGNIGNEKNIPVVIKLQPDYTVQFSLKKTSGQGLEETFSIMSSSDGWRYKSSGSGVAINKPHIFRVGNKDIFYIDKKSVTSNRNLRVEGDGYFRGKIVIDDKKIVWQAGYGSPDGKINAPVGSLYSKIDGGKNNTLYVKEIDNGTYGWTAK